MVSKEFGKTELKRQFANVKKDLQRYRFQLKVIDSEYPFNLHVTGCHVCFATVYENGVTGFASIDKSLVSTYNKLFEEEWENGLDFEEAIKTCKRELK